jgi:prepilin-type N-terminal cleavage/methylation domain-containing protein
MNSNNRSEKGFTLIELLVVIAIIGTLSGVVLVSLGDARAKARDATRQSDMRQVVSAMQLYYAKYEEYVKQEAQDKTDGTPDIDTYLQILHDPRCKLGACVEGFSDYVVKRNDLPVFCDVSYFNADIYQYYCIYAALENAIPPCSEGQTTYMVASQRGTKIVCGEAPSLSGDCTCFHTD